MSQITVGYTDKVRKTQTRGPPGGISDIFSSYSEEPSIKNKDNGKLHEQSVTANHNNGHTETKMCQSTESLSLESNSNQVRTTVESRKIVEQRQVISEEISNGNIKDNGNVEVSNKSTQKVGSITQSDEKDSATPSRRNRVPPGGYSSGFW